jgi:two-component system sensor histidine kinase PilS (NtrC family)
MELDRKIAPCPFSKQYRISEPQAWQSLTVYFLYRLTLGSTLAFLFFLGALPASLGRHDPELYSMTSSFYLGSTFFSAVPLFMRRPSFTIQAQIQVFIDIVLIPLIMHASGGVGSGVGVLLGLSVAAGGLLIGGRCALLFAALASLGILVEQTYADLTQSFPDSDINYTYAGMLGASFFGIAILALVLAQRAEQSEAVAAQRGADLANLQQLNEFIIQHLQSGILIVDEYYQIRLLNNSAARLLNISRRPQPLQSACPLLAQSLSVWVVDSSRDHISLRLGVRQPIHVRFTRLGQIMPPIYMIFLEDNTLHNQRVQHSKLASLGRLTASIAHEIRNPLSAISHASQLLAECPSLEAEDYRLTQIILNHAIRVNTVIENVLQISRRDPSKREVVPLASTLARFLRDYQIHHQVDEALFRLEVQTNDAKILIDPSQLRQILDNLCSNALKYGKPEKGAILLRALLDRGEVCLEIIDHSPPIDSQIVQQMFEPFFTTSDTGTGLGLYIARELAELNQARLEYEPLDEGGCFRLYLMDAEKTVVAL